MACRGVISPQALLEGVCGVKGKIENVYLFKGYMVGKTNPTNESTCAIILVIVLVIILVMVLVIILVINFVSRRSFTIPPVSYSPHDL